MRLEGQKILGCGGVTSTKNFDQFIESRSTTSQVESTTADKLKVSSQFFLGPGSDVSPGKGEREGWAQTFRVQMSQKEQSLDHERDD